MSNLPSKRITSSKKEHFLPGRIVATPGALAAPEASGEQPFEYLARHISGDWVRSMNTTGRRMMSA
jgi:hypothetical protein